jgi:hypothetical protein
MGQPNGGMPLQNLKKWPLRSEATQGQKNMVQPALGDESKIYLPSMHIKLVLIQVFVIAVDEES